LRRLRLDRALSQEELAHRAKVARTTVMRAELGLEIRPSSLRRLAHALGVRPSVLQRSD
jgi:transcriptional regulator with XRE-family HTH domain